MGLHLDSLSEKKVDTFRERKGPEEFLVLATDLGNWAGRSVK